MECIIFKKFKKNTKKEHSDNINDKEMIRLIINLINHDKIDLISFYKNVLWVKIFNLLVTKKLYNILD